MTSSETAATALSRSKHGLTRDQLNRLLAGQMPDCYNVFVIPWEDGFQPQVVIIRSGHPYTALMINGSVATMELALHAGYQIAMHHRQVMFIDNSHQVHFRVGPVEGQANWPWQ